MKVCADCLYFRAITYFDINTKATTCAHYTTQEVPT